MLNKKRLAVLFFITVFAHAAGRGRLRAFPAADDVSGAWDFTVETPQGKPTPTVIFKQDGEKLTGTYRGRLGETSLEGTLKEKKIQFTVKLKFRDQDFQVTYTGTVDGDSMKGTVQFREGAPGTWTARRHTGSLQ